MTTLSPTVPALIVAALLSLGAPAQDPVAQAPAPQAGGVSVATWASRLKDKVDPWVAMLAATGAESLPVLDQLVEHENYYVKLRAHIVIERLGPIAKPLTNRLWHLMQAKGQSWSTRENCVTSLGAIGTRRPDIQESIVNLCVSTPVPSLRHTCARTLLEMTPDTVGILLERAAKGAFPKTEDGVKVLVSLGVASVPSLIAALDKEDDAGGIARLALPRLGWRAAGALQRAGHLSLAQESLSIGAQDNVTGAETHRIEVLKPQPPLNRLPTFEFETGSGHGHNLTLWRAREDRGGLLVERIKVVRPRDTTEDGPAFVLTTDRAIVPRVIAFDFARQIVALRHMVAHPPAQPETWMSTGNFHARAEATLDDEVLLNETFTGYPKGQNVAERFRAQAARTALFQLSRTASWTPRPISDEDRTMVEQRAKSTGKDTRWVRERVAAMAELIR